MMTFVTDKYLSVVIIKWDILHDVKRSSFEQLGIISIADELGIKVNYKQYEKSITYSYAK